MDKMLSCIDMRGDDWLHNCPGETADEYFEEYARWDRACDV